MTCTIYSCGNCGSLDIEYTAYVQFNGNTIVHGDGPTNQVWCPVCEIHDAPVEETEGCWLEGARDAG